MINIFEQQMKIMEQASDQWRKTVAENSFFSPGGSDAFKENAARWVATMSATYKSNLEAWNSFLEQNREAFLRMYKNSPFFNDATERKIREACDDMAKARQTYQEMIQDSLARIESSLKESTDEK